MDHARALAMGLYALTTCLTGCLVEEEAPARQALELGREPPPDGGPGRPPSHDPPRPGEERPPSIHECLGDETTDPETGVTLCREIRGLVELKDCLANNCRPTLYAPYQHAHFTSPVTLGPIDQIVQCHADSDCADFHGDDDDGDGVADGNFARCGHGDEIYSPAGGVVEDVDGLAGQCIHVTAWDSGGTLRIQARNAFDTNAGAVVCQVRNATGDPVVTHMELSAAGNLYVTQAGDEVLPIELSEHCWSLPDTLTWGGAAQAYLAANYVDAGTGQVLYHQDMESMLDNRDLWDVTLPELPAGFYEIHMLYDPQRLIELGDPGAQAIVASNFLADGTLGIDWTAPLFFRVRGPEYDSPFARGQFRVEVANEAFRIRDAQESFDDPRINLRVQRVSAGAGDDAEAEVETLTEATAQFDEVFGNAPKTLPGSMKTTAACGPSDALLVQLELFEDDGGGVPTEVTDMVDGATDLLIGIFTKAVAEEGIGDVFKFCTDGPICGIAAGVVLVAQIAVAVVDGLGEAEFLGSSVDLYSCADLWYLMHAWQLEGETPLVDLAPQHLRELHDAGDVFLLNIEPTTGQFTYPAGGWNEGTVQVSVKHQMDGELTFWQENGAFVPGAYHEFTTIRAIDTEVAPDDTSTYVFHQAFTRE